MAKASSIFISLLLSLIATHQAAAPCLPDSAIDQLWSGTASLVMEQTPGTTLVSFQTYNLTLPRRYSRDQGLKYAFGLSSLQVSTPVLFYFDLLVLRTFQSSLILNFIHEPTKWKTVTYHYLVSFREDIQMGIASLNQNQLLKKDREYQVSIRVETDHLKIDKYVAMVFINGVKHQKQHQNAGKHQLGLYTVEQKVRDYELKVKMEDVSSVPLEQVTVSYILYVPEDLPLVSYGGVISKIQPGQNLGYILPQYHFTSLYGLSALLPSSKHSNTGYSLHFQVSPDYSLTPATSSNLEYFQISYVIIGKATKQICKEQPACQSTSQVYLHREQCVTFCPETTKPVTHIDGGVQCQDCQANATYDPEKGDCVCLQGFSQGQNGQCVQTVVNSQALFSVLPKSDSLGSCIKIVEVQENDKNLFVRLSVSAEVSADPDVTTADYLSIKWPDPATAPNSYYCAYDSSAFSCLLLYAEGLPPALFTMEFSCVVNEREKCIQKLPYKSIRKGT